MGLVAALSARGLLRRFRADLADWHAVATYNGDPITYREAGHGVERARRHAAGGRPIPPDVEAVFLEGAVVHALALTGLSDRARLVEAVNLTARSRNPRSTDDARQVREALAALDVTD